MRAARMLAGLSLLIALGAGAFSQTPPSDAFIAVPTVEVRSGPTSKFYVTSILRQGTPVHILQEKDGWLAITPPPGSFSWINGRLVDRQGRTAIVLTPDAPVRVGSSLKQDTPDVEQVKLARGAQVVIVGEPYIDKDTGKWWPIQPPPQEVRYIPKDAVRTTPTVETVSKSPAGAAWPVPGAPSPTMQQAEQAEKAGQIAEAIRLYEKAGQEVANSNHDLAMRCYSRADCLRKGNTGSVPPGYQPGIPAQASTGTDPRIAPIPNYTPGTPAPGQLTGQSQAAGYGPRPVAPAPGPMQSSGLGRLRRAGFLVDGKQAYVLENSQGRPQYYVTAQPPLNLEPYVMHVINLVGTAVYRGDLRANYMTASGVSQVAQ